MVAHGGYDPALSAVREWQPHQKPNAPSNGSPTWTCTTIDAFKAREPTLADRGSVWFRAEGSNLDCRVQSAVSCRLDDLGSETGARCRELNWRPAAYKAAALPTELTEPGVIGGTRIHLRRCHRAPRRLLPPRPRLERRAGVAPANKVFAEPCRSLWLPAQLARPVGFEPTQTGLEPVMLPLHQGRMNFGWHPRIRTEHERFNRPPRPPRPADANEVWSGRRDIEPVISGLEDQCSTL
jgi:hypothetical protein